MHIPPPAPGRSGLPRKRLPSLPRTLYRLRPVRLPAPPFGASAPLREIPPERNNSQHSARNAQFPIFLIRKRCRPTKIDPPPYQSPSWQRVGAALVRSSGDDQTNRRQQREQRGRFGEDAPGFGVVDPILHAYCLYFSNSFSKSFCCYILYFRHWATYSIIKPFCLRITSRRLS